MTTVIRIFIFQYLTMDCVRCRLSPWSPNCVEICQTRYERSIQCYDGIYVSFLTYGFQFYRAGYHLLVRHALVLTLAPFAAMGFVRFHSL